MSTILNTNGIPLTVPEITQKAKGCFYIITAEWNTEITHSLRDGAVRILSQAGVQPEKIILLQVPGTVELVNAAAAVMNKSRNNPASDNGDAVEAIIIIGCVIRGDTPHFDYVCHIAAQGTAELNAEGTAPVIFGVLTVENQDQALQRAGGTLGNKGEEAADTAVRMVNLHASLNS